MRMGWRNNDLQLRQKSTQREAEHVVPPACIPMHFSTYPRKNEIDLRKPMHEQGIKCKPKYIAALTGNFSPLSTLPTESLNEIHCTWIDAQNKTDSMK